MFLFLSFDAPKLEKKKRFKSAQWRSFERRYRRKGEDIFSCVVSLALNLCSTKFVFFFFARFGRLQSGNQVIGHHSPSLSAEFLSIDDARLLKQKKKTFSLLRDKLIEPFFGVGNLHFKFFQWQPLHFHCQSKARWKGHETFLMACMASCIVHLPEYKQSAKALEAILLRVCESSVIFLLQISHYTLRSKKRSISFQIVKLKQVLQQIID